MSVRAGTEAGCRAGSDRSRLVHHSPKGAPGSGDGGGRGRVQVLVGVQVCVVVVLMPDVLVSCFCMGLLLCSSSLRREEDVDKLYAQGYTRCLLLSHSRRLCSTRWVHLCGGGRYLRLIDLTFHLHRAVVVKRAVLLSPGESDFTGFIESHV